MKKSLLARLRCPNCLRARWDLQKRSEDEREIRAGTLTCLLCRVEYPVEDGILNMVRELPDEVAREKEHAESFGYLTEADGTSHPINRQTIQRFRPQFLSLPGGDGSHFFNPGGSFYNQAGNARRFFKAMEMLSLEGKESVLEVGASFGWGAWRFAQRGCDVVALDVTSYLMAGDLYLEEDGSYFDRVMADMNRLPFCDGSFDLIFSHSAIHHARNLADLFSEFRRVLRPGRRLVALHECSFGIFEDKSGKALQDAIHDGFNENAFTLPEWKKGARSGGFRDVRFHFFSFVDDYIDRKTLRGAPKNWKWNLASWAQSHPRLHQAINRLTIYPRILFRPKDWMLIATRQDAG